MKKINKDREIMIQVHTHETAKKSFINYSSGGGRGESLVRQDLKGRWGTTRDYNYYERVKTSID